MDTESRAEIEQRLREEGSYCLMGTELLFGMMKKF